MKHLLLFVFIVTANLGLLAQGIVYINENNKDGLYDLSGNIFYLIDSADEYTFEQVLSNDFDSKFTQSATQYFTYRHNAPIQWYKIVISNNTKNTEELVFAINNPLITDITFFNTFDSAYYHTGLFHPFKQRQIFFKNYLFKIKVLPGQQGTACFKIAAQLQPEYLPLLLMSQSEASTFLRSYSFSEGVYYCIMLVFIFLIFILWQSENEKSYISLLSFVLIGILVGLWRESHLYQYLWPQSPQLNYAVGKILHAVFLFFLFLFVYSKFKIKKPSKQLHVFARIGIALSLIFVLAQFIIVKYTFFFYGFRILIAWLTAVSVWGFIKARSLKIPYFVHYSVALFFMEMVICARVFLFVDSYGLGMRDTQLLSLATLVFFVIVIYIFISKFKNSRLEVIGLNKNLEYLVEKRTEQISSQKEELKSQHEELIQQKETLQTQREELRAKKELLEIRNAELAKLSLVASKTDNLIYIFLPNGELDWFNASFSSNLGMSIEEYHRGEPMSIIDVSSNKNIRHVLNTCLREKTVVSYESGKVLENNESVWYHTTLTPILDDRDNIEYLIAIDTDISQLKRYEDKLEQKSKDAEHQKNLAVMRKEELEERQIEITDSIRYAKRIQTGIMPKVKQIQRDFHDSFVLFVPKDIVSGDFYWYHRIKDKYFIAAVDCTGHGVPGAFMSIIGTYLLNSIIINNGVENPTEILKQLNRKIKIALKADNRSQSSDGMDLSIAVIDKNEKSIEIASALRPVYMFCGGDFIEIKGDKIPITSNISGTSISSFTNHKHPFDDGDVFYMFSDGIIDQFGGKRSKKYLTKRFKQLLFEINPLSMREQKEIIKKAFDDWRGENEQVDDVLVMGIRYKNETGL